MVDWVGPVVGAAVGFGGSWLLLFYQQRRQDEGVRRQLIAMFQDVTDYVRQKSTLTAEHFEKWGETLNRLRDRAYSADTAMAVKPETAAEMYGAVRFLGGILKTARGYNPLPPQVPGSTKQHFRHEHELLMGTIRATEIEEMLGDKTAAARLVELRNKEKTQIGPLAGKSAEVTQGPEQIEHGP